jgi:hypothetical protein
VVDLGAEKDAVLPFSLTPIFNTVGSSAPLSPHPEMTRARTTRPRTVEPINLRSDKTYLRV